MTTTAPPTTTLERNLAFITEHADLFAQHHDGVTMVSANAYTVYIDVTNEGTAVDLAIALGINAAPRYSATPEYDHFIRETTIHGIKIRLASVIQINEAAA